jgi:predicted transcriptional regulator
MDRTKAKMVTLEIASVADVKRRVSDAFKGRKQQARISFASPELLWKALTAKRWELLKAMAGRGPMTIRAAARRVGRDVKAVHGDVHAMLDCGLLDRIGDGRIEFRFDGVHVDFTLLAA